MPVTINELDSRIDVEGPSDPADQSRPRDPAEALQRFAEHARQLKQREARTAAWDFDD